MSGWGWFFLILLLILLAYGGFVGYRIFKARKNGEPIGDWKAFIPFMKTQSSTNYPTPRSSGPLDWVKDKIAGFRNKRTTQGGYEESRGVDVENGGYSGVNTTTGGSGRRGRGHEDDAWDSRVGNEDPYGHGPGGYYEEQELGLAPTPGFSNQPYGGAGAGAGGDYMSQSTEYGGSSAGATRGGLADARLDPFHDRNQAPSLRSVSPRPDGGHTRGQASIDSTGSGDGNTSPISTRKSAFREGI